MSYRPVFLNPRSLKLIPSDPKKIEKSANGKIRE
jgi:hypothetical protein